jgi:hypothetical protein
MRLLGHPRAMSVLACVPITTRVRSAVAKYRNGRLPLDQSHSTFRRLVETG